MVRKSKKAESEKQISQPSNFFDNSISIVILGHVDHGKTTLAKALTGQWLSKHSEEIKRGMTIKLGYSNFDIYKCEEHGYMTEKICPICNKENKFIRKVSIVDAPGHEALTMVALSGAALVDAGILVIDVNDKFPQTQTLEHLIAFKYLKNRPLIIVQNKIDLSDKEKVKENYKQILDLLKNLNFDLNKVIIIPISAINRINIKYLLESLANIDIPKRDIDSDPIFLCSRSFDINKPGTPIEKLVGGVLGGSLLKGTLKVGQEIEIKPGVLINNQWVPIKTKVISLRQFDMDVDKIYPGPTAGIGTLLDPFVTKDDTLAGQIVGLSNKLPDIIQEIEIKYEIIKELNENVNELKKGEKVLICFLNIITEGLILNINKDLIKIRLSKPILNLKDQNIIILRNIDKRWKIYGYGRLL